MRTDISEQSTKLTNLYPHFTLTTEGIHRQCRQTKRQTDGQTNMQTNRQTHEQRDEKRQERRPQQIQVDSAH